MQNGRALRGERRNAVKILNIRRAQNNATPLIDLSVLVALHDVGIGKDSAVAVRKKITIDSMITYEAKHRRKLNKL